VEQDRDRLRDLSARLLRLHRVLLDRERRAYEDRHGAIPSRELLHLALHDEQFAWLRSLSTMIAHIDEIVDADEPIVPEGVQNVLREAYRLIRSGDRGAFQDKYRVALQESPDVVMAHAEVSRVLPASVGTATSP
jgi:hypothetical protein